MAERVKVATVSEIASGAGKTVQVRGQAVALFNCGGTYYAIENACKHRGGSLGQGALAGTQVSCPLHGWGYDVTSGACAITPQGNVRSFEVKVEGTDVYVTI